MSTQMAEARSTSYRELAEREDDYRGVEQQPQIETTTTARDDEMNENLSAEEQKDGEIDVPGQLVVGDLSPRSDGEINEDHRTDSALPEDMQIV